MYNTVLYGLTRDSEAVGDGFMIYSKMLQNHIRPDIYTYNSLAYGLCLQFKVEEADRFLKLVDIKHSSKRLYLWALDQSSM